MALTVPGLVSACPALVSADGLNDGREARDIAICEAIKALNEPAVSHEEFMTSLGLCPHSPSSGCPGR
jgi:hypothetical protein